MSTLTHGAKATARRRPVHVAHCIHGLGLGGAQQVIRYLVAHSDPSRYRYFIYSPEDGAFRAPIEEAGAIARIVPRSRGKLDWTWAKELARLMRSDEIDVVHTHLFGDSLHGYLAARMAGRLPVVMTLHISTDGVRPVQRLAYWLLINRVARAIGCAPSVASSFKRWPGLKHRTIEVIANGIDFVENGTVHGPSRAKLRAALSLPEGCPVIGAMGRLVEQKSFDTLIRAFAEIRAAPLPWLVLVGDGPLREKLEREAALCGVADRTLFTGFRNNAVQLLRAFDVVAFSSLYEGLPIALLEAMAMRSCIVATTTPGIADVVRDGREALLVPPKNIEAMAHALTLALNELPLREKLSSAARARFESEYTATRMAQLYHRVYDEVLH